jgi:hypothetical protein
MAPNTTPETTKSKSCIKVYPLDLEERVEGGTLEQVIDLKDSATTYRGNIGPTKVTTTNNTVCRTYSSIPCSINILASNDLIVLDRNIINKES